MKTANWRKIRNGKVNTPDAEIWVYDSNTDAVFKTSATVFDPHYTHWKKVIDGVDPGMPVTVAEDVPKNEEVEDDLPW